MIDFVLPIANLAIAVWAGAIVFHSAVVAPAVFRQLDETAARGFLRTIFPRFYRLGLYCGVIAIIAFAIAVLAGGGTFLQLALAAVILMTAMEAASLRLTPVINAARDAGEAGRGRFETLHRLSVILTVVILLLAVAILLLLPGASG